MVTKMVESKNHRFVGPPFPSRDRSRDSRVSPFYVGLARGKVTILINGGYSSGHCLIVTIRNMTVTGLATIGG